MIEIKIFSAINPQSVEDECNAFLAHNDIEIINIKMCDSDGHVVVLMHVKHIDF